MAQPSVIVEDDALVIRELRISGPALEAVREAVARGLDPERVVREALEVGGAILLHGASKATVDAVGAEVDRLLSALAQRDDWGRAMAAERARIPAALRSADRQRTLSAG
ncbi:MAG TPA: hypothetical protein VFM57_12270 [Thermoleophilaceae bacterium]|nr:hypothetical protein [Thermoleophilaceae bacterium]